MFHPLLRATFIGALLCTASPVLAQTEAPADTQSDMPTDPGAYLAARSAAAAGDFAAAATYFGEALQADPENPALLESSAMSLLSLGHLDRAVLVAARMRDAGIESQIATLILFAGDALQGDWDAIANALDGDATVSPLFDALTLAWAMVGKGQMTDALAQFDKVIGTEGMRGYGLFSKALALASVGDFESAEAIFADPGTGATAFSPRGAIAYAQTLSQLDRNTEAAAMLEEVFGPTLDPAVVALRAQLEDGETIPYTLVRNPAEGVGEVAFVIAGILAAEAREDYTLLYSRAAQALNPDNTAAILLTAELLQTLGRYELASDAFAQVAQDDPNFAVAELGRIDALRESGQPAVAVEVADALARSLPNLAFVHARRGDALRDVDRLDDAFDAYSRALELYPADDANRWLVLYTRAITAHQIDDWPQAEADFRAALALRPDQPAILNYLGYSLVERGEKLDEALSMIETAVDAQPENGAIVDSLGWVYFTLGRYTDAVAPLERAAALEATDPVVNDHLGDAYWAVGRTLEAEFQWKRALSFEPTDKDTIRIRAKLASGLDAVLKSEGLAPTRTPAATAAGN